MPKYPKNHYDKFVKLANEQGSGLGKGWQQDGALKSLGALLRKDSLEKDIVSAIKALADVKDNTHTNKQRKYKKAIRHLEDTFPIPQDKRVWRGVEAVKYLREPTPPSVTFKGNNIDYSSLKLTKTTCGGLHRRQLQHDANAYHPPGPASGRHEPQVGWRHSPPAHE